MLSQNFLRRAGDSGPVDGKTLRMAAFRIQGGEAGMSRSRRQSAFRAVAHWDQSVTVMLNRMLQWRKLAVFFSAISIMGNGRLWYLIMSLLPLLHGRYGLAAGLHMGLTGLATLLIYRCVKGATQRPRPGAVHESILQGAASLDEYSFPSGHTMHAVAFSVVAAAWFPGLLPCLAGFSFLTGISRIVLGLHYPTDVILGAIFGLMLGQGSLLLLNLF